MFIEDDIKVGMLFHTFDKEEDYYFEIKSLSNGPCIIKRDDGYTIQISRLRLLSFLNNGDYQPV